MTVSLFTVLEARLIKTKHHKGGERKEKSASRRDCRPRDIPGVTLTLFNGQELQADNGEQCTGCIVECMRVLINTG